MNLSKGIVVGTVIGIFIFLSGSLFAQNKVAANDSTKNAKIIKELTLKKEALEKRIAIEDGKRNQSLNGVSEESMEMINDKQDSLCLQLRSDLVTVKLELEEVTPDNTVSTIVDKLGNMLKNKANATPTNTEKK